MQSGQDISTLALSGPIDALCPQSSSFGLLRCLGHQHIGGRCVRLINADTGEELCRSCPSYGTADRTMPGNEQGYLVKMSEATMEAPLHILPGTNVTIESDYDASVDHFGVMALFFLDLVDFDKSCPGPITTSTGNHHRRWASVCLQNHMQRNLVTLGATISQTFMSQILQVWDHTFCMSVHQWHNERVTEDSISCSYPEFASL